MGKKCQPWPVCLSGWERRRPAHQKVAGSSPFGMRVGSTTPSLPLSLSPPPRPPFLSLSLKPGNIHSGEDFLKNQTQFLPSGTPVGGMGRTLHRNVTSWGQSP